MNVVKMNSTFLFISIDIRDINGQLLPATSSSAIFFKSINNIFFSPLSPRKRMYLKKLQTYINYSLNCNDCTNRSQCSCDVVQTNIPSMYVKCCESPSILISYYYGRANFFTMTYSFCCTHISHCSGPGISQNLVHSKI